MICPCNHIIIKEIPFFLWVFVFFFKQLISNLFYVSYLLCMCWWRLLCVDYMHYADRGEPGAINKTQPQCAHWRNNLSDTMEKE